MQQRPECILVRTLEASPAVRLHTDIDLQYCSAKERLRDRESTFRLLVTWSILLKRMKSRPADLDWSAGESVKDTFLFVVLLACARTTKSGLLTAE